MSLTAWILIMLALVLGATAGFYFGRANSLDRRRADALEEELERSRAELRTYRSEVSRHFQGSAALFTQMAGTYRDLYHHLAEGAGRLTDIPPSHLLSDRAAPLDVIEARPEASEQEAPPLDLDALRRAEGAEHFDIGPGPLPEAYESMGEPRTPDEPAPKTEETPEQPPRQENAPAAEEPEAPRSPDKEPDARP